MTLEGHHGDPTMAGRGRVPGFVGEPGRTDAALVQEAALAGEPAPADDLATDPNEPPAVGVAKAPHISGTGEPVIQTDAHAGEAAVYPGTSGGQNVIADQPALPAEGAAATEDDTTYDAADAAQEARAENDLDRTGADTDEEDHTAAATAAAGSAGAIVRHRAGQAGEVITAGSRERSRGRNVIVGAALLLGAAAVACVVWASNPNSPDQANRPPATDSPENVTPQPGDGQENEGDGTEEDAIQVPPLDELPETYDGTSTWPWGDAAGEVGPARANEHLRDQIASAREHGAVVKTFSVTDKNGNELRWGIISVTYPATDGSTQVARSTEDVVDVLDFYGNLN
jgi:hypothetical protein